ncbi:hypothetical protein SOCE26_065520 [Sorangium cellulosum]|uniref:AgmX/PglI C-terminal domain-containing protein n=1 Tax=Sorangium cellulosum TaxID=56 RepID=A0A2L0F0K1_SORCE|nr:hypothetical protein [Sorangium cellulosum]AUX45071.1 hypothetical protein SOCE26_065520 [Sorangium cellulosum]
MGRQLSTSTAILLGSAMIAAAVYLGLRHGPSARDPEAHDPAARRDERAPGADAPAPGATPAPSATPARSATPRDEVARRAAEALEAHRAALMQRCYTPAIAAQPERPVVKYVFNITFDAQGRQVARGVIEDRETARPEVTACLGTALPPLSIPPPGARVRVDVPFSLP